MQKSFYIFCTIAIVFITVSPSYAVESYGNPEDSVVAEVLGIEIRTKDPVEMQAVINQKLFHAYAKQHTIEASQEDIDSYIALMDQFMSDDRKKMDARLVEIKQQLKSETLPAEQSKQLQSEFATLDTFRKEEIADDKASKKDKKEVLKIRKAMATSSIEQWKINKALYLHYGGRIIGQQMGPEPLDAMHKFLQEQQKNGAFKILEKSFEASFWEYFVNESKHDFYKQGSEEERLAFDKAPWQ